MYTGWGGGQLSLKCRVYAEGVCWLYRDEKSLGHYGNSYSKARLSPMIPKMPKMLGAKITSRLMQVSRPVAMSTCRNQLNSWF